MRDRGLGWPDVDHLRSPVELDVVARGGIPAFQAPTVSARSLAKDLHQHRSVIDLDDAKLTDAIVGHALEFAAIEDQPAFLKGVHRIAPDTEREAVAFAGRRVDLLKSLAHGKIVERVHLRAGTHIADNG